MSEWEWYHFISFGIGVFLFFGLSLNIKEILKIWCNRNKNIIRFEYGSDDVEIEFKDEIPTELPGLITNAIKEKYK